MVAFDAREFVTRLNELDPLTFERMVVEALIASGRFSDVSTSVRLGTVESDFIAREARDGASRRVAVEVKHRLAVDVATIRMFIGLRESVRRAAPEYTFIAIVSGALTAAARREAEVAELEVWDGTALVSVVPDDVRERYLGVVTPNSTSAIAPRGRALSDALATIRPGRPQWSEYQRLVAQIADYLFVPPLTDLVSEAEDEARRNRRDIVLTNPARDDFWHRMRIESAPISWTG